MSASPHARRTGARDHDRRRAVAEHEDLHSHLVSSCVLLLLVERPASSLQLHEALGALRLSEDPLLALQCALEVMEETGLVFSTWGPGASCPDRHTFHITPAGSLWLRHAIPQLRTAEGILGAFVARCSERFVTPS